MSPLILLAIQIVSSFIVFGLFAVTVVAPRLRARPRVDGLASLLWVHTLRYVPLALLAPGQTSASIPRWVASTIAWGDFASATMAVVAIVAVHMRGERGLRWVWAFTIASTADIAVGLTVGLGNAVHEHALGVGWYVLTLYVPIVCVAQGMIVGLLVRGRAIVAG